MSKEILELIEVFNTFVSDDKNRDIFIESQESLVKTISGLYEQFKQRKLPPYSSEDLLTLIAVYSYKAFIDERFIIPYSEEEGDNITTFSKDLRRFSTLLYHYYNFFVNPMRADEIMEYIGDKAFFLRLMDEFSNRICVSVVGKNLFTLLFDNSKEGFDTLMRIVKKKVKNLYLPTTIIADREREKDSALYFHISDIIENQIRAKLTPFEFIEKALDQKLNWFPDAIWKRFINTVKKQATQKKRIPEVRLDDDNLSIELLNTDDVVKIDDEPVLLTLTESDREYFKTKCGEKAVEILDFMLKNPDITKKKEIAKGVNCHPNTVTKYFKFFRSERSKLLEIVGKPIRIEE